MRTKTKAVLSVDIHDVVKYGGVREAIIALCEDSDDTSSGVIGPSFSTSGPGSGWSKQHDASDYAARALDTGYGALYYIDADNGRRAKMVGEDRYAIVDASGEYVTESGGRTPASDEARIWDRELHADRHLEKMEDDEDGHRATDMVVELEKAEIEWSDESVVELVCPDEEDALAHPEQVSDMAKDVIRYHGAESDIAAWKKLVLAIQDAGNALSDVDADDLEVS